MKNRVDTSYSNTLCTDPPRLWNVPPLTSMTALVSLGPPTRAQRVRAAEWKDIGGGTRLGNTGDIDSDVVGRFRVCRKEKSRKSYRKVKVIYKTDKMLGCSRISLGWLNSNMEWGGRLKNKAYRTKLTGMGIS